MRKTEESLFGDAESDIHSGDDGHAITFVWFVGLIHWYSPQFRQILKFKLFGEVEVEDLLISSLPTRFGLGSDFYKDLKPDFENDIRRAQASAKCYSY